MNIIPAPADPMSLADWLAIPDDVKAGIFEEVDELHSQGIAKQHPAWRFVQPFLADEAERAVS
ncbi:MAG: hypothetical protein NVS9B2_28890 [Steroidobacteraceae bacterium]